MLESIFHGEYTVNMFDKCHKTCLGKAQHGTDVTLSCEVSRLPGSSTLQWEREGAPIANTSLLLNNTAYIILHSVDQRSQGKYTCKLRHRGKVELLGSRTLNVSQCEYTVDPRGLPGYVQREPANCEKQ